MNSPAGVSIRVRLPHEDEEQRILAKEEVIILWDRIIAVVLLIALLVGLLFMAIQYWRSNEKTQSFDSGVEVSAANKEAMLSRDLPAQTPKALTAVDVKEPLLTAQESAHSAIEFTVADEAKYVKPIAASSSAPVDNIEKPRPANLAKVVVHSSAVLAAQLSTQLQEDGQAANNALAIIPVKEGELLTLYFLTKIQHFRSQTMYFNWYRNNASVAKVRIRPKSNITNTFSSKYIDQHMTGDWRVALTTQNGKVLASAEFTIVDFAVQ